MNSVGKHEPANNPDSGSLERTPSLGHTEDLSPNKGAPPPRDGFTVERGVAAAASTSTLATTSHHLFRPPLLGQLTLKEAFGVLDWADALWNGKCWGEARVRYTTAAAIFHVLEDMRNEAFCLQRLGDVCRIIRDYSAARAHISQAHALFGKCGELARQLMCERWFARIASDQGMKQEAQQLLHAALDKSRSAGLRESQGWCLLRLGELEEVDESFIQEALDIAREENIPLLESRCKLAASRKHQRALGLAATTVARAGLSNHRNGGVPAASSSSSIALAMGVSEDRWRKALKHMQPDVAFIL